MDGDLAILRCALPSQGAVPTGEVVTTGYGKTSNAGFPNEHSHCRRLLNSIARRIRRAPLFGRLVRVSWSATADRAASRPCGNRRAR